MLTACYVLTSSCCTFAAFSYFISDDKRQGHSTASTYIPVLSCPSRNSIQARSTERCIGCYMGGLAFSGTRSLSGFFFLPASQGDIYSVLLSIISYYWITAQPHPRVSACVYPFAHHSHRPPFNRHLEIRSPSLLPIMPLPLCVAHIESPTNRRPYHRLGSDDNSFNYIVARPPSTAAAAAYANLFVPQFIGLAAV